MNEMAVETSLDLGDYLSAFKRRRLMIVLIAVPIFIIGTIVAYTLPPTYESSSTILIEQQEIPIDLVRSTVTTFAAQTIQTIAQRVMTRSNLLEIMDTYDLFMDDRKHKVTEEIIADMREDIKIDMVTAQVMDPRTGSPTNATIAFTVGFQGENPVTVQKVANELTTLYLNENLRTRTEKAQETYDFLTTEANRLKEKILEMDKALTAFKKLNNDLLPENREITVGMMARTEGEIERIETEVRVAEETRTYLQGQLALLDPHGTEASDDMSPTSRLQTLYLQHSSMSSQYSADHPDILRVKREIEILERETGVVDSTENRVTRLNGLRNTLSTLEKNYSSDYPDIKKLKREIATLEEDIQTSPAPVTTIASKTPSTNPAYNTLENQIKTNKIKTKLLYEQKTALKEKIVNLEERLLQMPQIEGEYRAISREYTNATTRYQSIKAKQTTAEIAQELERERKGEKFTLIDPPALPEKPISPNRPSIVFLSLILSLGAGIGLAIGAESINSVIRGAKGVIATVHTSPLAVIPYLATVEDILKKKKRRRLGVALILISIATTFLLVHLFYLPLDVIWFRILRKTGLTTIGE